jgi:hypothetical protein
MEQNSSGEVISVKKFPPFIEPENSVPCSQESMTKPYPEPDESSSHPYILFH